MRSWRESRAWEEFGIPNPAKEIAAIILMLNQPMSLRASIKNDGMLSENAKREKRLAR
jgi:hypothetical protein